MNIEFECCGHVVRLLNTTFRCRTPLDDLGRCVNACHHIDDETEDEQRVRVRNELVRGST